MTITLHLGVVEVPYTDKAGVSTGDVAEFLEPKYHIMETFFEAHSQEVADAMATGMQGALESVLMGAPPPASPFAAGEAEVDHLFHRFLESGEMETLGIPGVPTKAAEERRSSRFKRKRSTRPRPSFIDTGLYDTSFKAWVEVQKIVGLSGWL